MKMYITVSALIYPTLKDLFVSLSPNAILTIGPYILLHILFSENQRMNEIIIFQWMEELCYTVCFSREISPTPQIYLFQDVFRIHFPPPSAWLWDKVVFYKIKGSRFESGLCHGIFLCQKIIKWYVWTVCQCPFFLFCPVFSPAEAIALCSLQARKDPSIVFIFLYVIQSNFLHYRALRVTTY